MGVFKKFIGGISLEGIAVENESLNKYRTINVIPCEFTDGTVFSSLILGADSSNYASFRSEARDALVPYQKLTAIATTDNIDEYSLNDYSVESVGNITQTISAYRGSNNAAATYSIVISNSNESSIDVSCIKFIKSINTKYNTTTGATNPKNLLICAYYLDAPLTIPAGESRTIVIEMKVGTDVSVSEL